MRRIWIAIAIVPLLLASAALAEDPQPTTTTPNAEPPPPTLVRVVVHRPARHRTIVRRFTPYAQPNAAQAMAIEQHEAARFGCNLGTLDYRITHESGYAWNASNGSHRGLLQFAYSTFTRGLSTMPRGIRIRSHTSQLRRSKVVRVYSDGHVVHHAGRLVRVRVLRIEKGTIPRWPGWTHGWAQIRIGCQALAGRSAVHASEWPWRY